MQTFVGVFPSSGLLAVESRTLDQGITAVQGDVVMNLSSLNLGGTAVVMFWAFDDQLVQNVDENLAHGRLGS